jgi:chemotaxis protein methyltransferase CheR
MQEFPPLTTTETSPNGALSELQEVETKLMLDAILTCYGFDFRDYDDRFLKEKIGLAMEIENAKTISGLQSKLLHDPECFDRFLLRLSSPPLGMYEDSDFFIRFRKRVVPLLKTYPSTRIWCAGCGTGEEAYSLAILLREEHLESRTTIYATDTNQVILNKAAEGKFLHTDVAKWESNYLKSGGVRLLSDYYTIEGNQAVFDSSLKRKICFSAHNPITDSSFNEFHVIVCRNFLNQLGNNLEEKVLKLFRESLITFGFLCIGRDEVPWLASRHTYFESVDSDSSFYRKLP